MALILLDEKIHALDEKTQESYTLLPIKIVRFRYRNTGEGDSLFVLVRKVGSDAHL